VVGVSVINPPLSGGLPVAGSAGGGLLQLIGSCVGPTCPPGGVGGSSTSAGIADSMWRRRAWRDLF
jgi:hypothetical protein